ncbi:MAG: hypothetical protein FWC79_03260 [Oscillospiraceae bacterium]|nr:hypothetical protein [Oscillospiraceae bacterium]
MMDGEFLPSNEQIARLRETIERLTPRIDAVKQISGSFSYVGNWQLNDGRTGGNRGLIVQAWGQDPAGQSIIRELDRIYENLVRLIEDMRKTNVAVENLSQYAYMNNQYTGALN